MKKIVLRKKVVEAPVIISYVPAIQMEEGISYINTGCTTIIKLQSIEPYEGHLKGVEAIHATKVRYTGISMTGDCLEGYMSGNCAVLTDLPDLEKKIRHSWGVYQGRIKALVAVKTSARPPKLDADGNVVERKPMGDKDQRTGCKLGTTGHEMGKIMLDTGWDKRVTAVALMTTWLEQQFEPKKARALAQSWYSTNMLRKSEIYANPKNYKGSK